MDAAVLANRRLSVRWYTPELQQSNAATAAAAGLTVAQALALLTLQQQHNQQAAGTAPQPHTTTDATTAQILMQQLVGAATGGGTWPSGGASIPHAADTANMSDEVRALPLESHACVVACTAKWSQALA
jgi:hypothetical protein